MTVSSFSRGCKHNNRIKLISTDKVVTRHNEQESHVSDNQIQATMSMTKVCLGYAKQDPTTCYLIIESLEVRSSSLPRFSTLAGELFVCDF